MFLSSGKEGSVKAVFVLFLMFFLLTGQVSWAQENKDPSLPAVLQTLSDQGAQIRYLGKEMGLDGWVTIKGGKEQYFYVTPDGGGVLMGLLFEKNGRMVTLRQVNELRKKEGDVLDLFALPEAEKPSPFDRVSDAALQRKTPAEQLFDDVENSNWVVLGNKDAPVIYSFIDPQCPHCRNLISDLRENYIGNGLVQVRVIPVGFRDETQEQAAFLLAAPDPEDRLYRYLDGDTAVLPATKSINQQAVQRNKAVMQSWKFNVTPITVYRSKSGEIKIVQGRAKNIPELIADLP